MDREEEARGRGMDPELGGDSAGVCPACGVWAPLGAELGLPCPHRPGRLGPPAEPRSGPEPSIFQSRASRGLTYLPWVCWGLGGWQTPRQHIPAEAAPGKLSDLCVWGVVRDVTIAPQGSYFWPTSAPDSGYRGRYVCSVSGGPGPSYKGNVGVAVTPGEELEVFLAFRKTRTGLLPPLLKPIPSARPSNQTRKEIEGPEG